VRHWFILVLGADPARADQLLPQLLHAIQASRDVAPRHHPAFPAPYFAALPGLFRDPVLPLAIVLAFCFLLRVNEYAATTGPSCLRDADLSTSGPSVVLCVLKSKTDPHPSFHRRTPGAGPLSLVALLDAYRAARGPGPRAAALTRSDGSALREEHVNEAVRALARAAGADAAEAAGYSSHGLRAGGAVAALTARWTDARLLREGRWASSRSIVTYVKTLAHPDTLAALVRWLPGVFTAPPAPPAALA